MKIRLLVRLLRLVANYHWFNRLMEPKQSMFILLQGLPGAQGTTGETGKPGDQVRVVTWT